MSAGSDSLWALVLAGGDGVRLQGLTRQLTGSPIPKQYCRIAGDRSMLEATLGRIASDIPAARTLVVVNQGHLPLAAAQTRDLPSGNLLVQADNNDTGPGVLFGLLALQARDAAATVAVFPSDHYIGDEAAFLAHVADGVSLVHRRPDKIVVLGIAPERPDPELGYLEVDDTSGADGGRVVTRFVEKPTPRLAARIVRRGGLWNSFVMLFRLETVLALLQRHRPAEYAAACTAQITAASRWNFSRDFLAHIPADLLALRVSDVGWSDWGTAEAIERTLVRMRITPPWRAAPRAAC
jgi:mannose-1-phosphate guanylyltransferase